ncbi:MAG: glycosyltransferase family 4 protein, partial [Acidimicrobiales bacterium]
MTKHGGPHVAYLLPDPGIPVGGTKGASVHVESLCSAMARAGAQVVLYAANVIGPLRAPGSDAVRVVPLDVGKVRSGPGGDRTRIAAAASFFKQVGRHLDTRRPDWVHERLSLFAGAGSAVCAVRDLSRVVEVNAPVSAERLRHFGLELVSEAESAEHDALRGARVLAVSQPLAEWVLACGASEALVVPNGADTDGLDPALWASRRIGIRRRLGLEGRVVVGFAGSLKPWHGIEVLFDAVAKVSRRSPLGLLVVGDGPGRAAAELAARSLPAAAKPVLTGSVPFSEI